MNYEISTIGQKNIKFRSCLQAQWAYFFDMLKWNWEYESINLNGYTPDFILKFPFRDVLVAILDGIDDKKQLTNHKNKILKSGWHGTYLILGTDLYDYNSQYISIGLLSATCPCHILCMKDCTCDKNNKEPPLNLDYVLLTYGCNYCSVSYSLSRPECWYTCLQCGADDKGLYEYWIKSKKDKGMFILDMWCDAKNIVEYRRLSTNDKISNNTISQKAVKKPIRKTIPESLKKRVAGKQLYTCANTKDSKLSGLEDYECPLWNGKNKGSFDESGYEIDHIVEHTLSNNNDECNLQALCRSCHMVKTMRFNSRYRKKTK